AKSPNDKQPSIRQQCRRVVVSSIDESPSCHPDSSRRVVEFRIHRVLASAVEAARDENLAVRQQCRGMNSTCDGETARLHKSEGKTRARLHEYQGRTNYQ